MAPQNDLFDVELELEQARERLHHFINRSAGQHLRYLRERWFPDKETPSWPSS